MTIHPDKNDLRLIKEYVILPLLLTIFELDKQLILRENHKIGQPYIDAIDRFMDAVTKDLVQVRKEMKKRNIVVYEETRTKDGIKCKYKFRGFHHTFEALSHYLRSICEVYMRKYFGEEIEVSIF